ncbi:MAG: LAGLIDADG family homing endonuclease [Candidatus Aenigmatarchaeota archaeon]
MEKYKILVLSDSPFFYTGYATQCKEIFKRLALREEWEVYYIGLGFGGVPVENPTLNYGLERNQKELESLPFTVIPGNYPPRHQIEKYGFNELRKWVPIINPDLIFILCDTFMVPHLYQQRKYWAPSKMIMYFPSDGVPLPHPHGPKVLNAVDYRVAMSKFGKKVAEDEGVPDVKYIPHGVDTAVFKPIEDKISLREKWSNMLGVDLQNKFIVGWVGKNQPRKALPDFLKALKEFEKDKEDVLALMHCNPNAPGGHPLMELAKKYGVDHCVKFTGHMSFGRDQLAELYNLFNVNLSLTCYTPNTLISTENGFKEIKDIMIGDKVLTIDGTFQRVENSIFYEYNDDILEVETTYNPSVKITPNHKVYGMKCENQYQKAKLKKELKIEKRPIEEFSEGDYLLIPRIKKTKDRKDVSKELMWLYGYYLADGCISQKHNKPEGLVLCQDSRKKALTKKLLSLVKKCFDIEGKVHDRTRHRRTIRCYSVELGKKFKEMFGSGAKNKRIPKWMLYLPKDKQQALIDGYLEGDGHLSKDKRTNLSKMYRVDTVSRELAYFIRLILIRLGKLCSFKIQERESTVYRLGFSVDPKQTVGWIHDEFMITRINKIKRKKWKGLVYDLTIEKNHNYCNYWIGVNSGEGFGVCTIESMACGVPMVITDYTTTKEIIPEDTGKRIELQRKVVGTYTVERGFANIMDAVDKLNEYYNNPQYTIRDGMYARKHVLKNYHWDIVYPQWEAWFKELLEDIE